MEKIPNRKLQRNLESRYLFEICFRLLGIFALLIVGIMIVSLMYSIISKGYSAFYTNYIVLNINNNSDINEVLKENLKSVGYNGAIDSDDIISIVDSNVNVSLAEQRFLVTSNVDMYLKNYIGSGSIVSTENIKVIDALKNSGKIITKTNIPFLSNADSRIPEIAGFKGALVGTLYTAMLTIIFAVLIGIGAAVYLEQFATKNRTLSFIEVNINNLAAVPSIIFGLLGLIVFQQFFSVERATPLLASFVLTLMALPTIIISSRIALSSVPKSTLDAAYAMGSSKIQVILYHLLPISTPGILTGVIIGISRVIGETAPLILIGMVAFINAVPSSIHSTSTALPVQILLWSDSIEIGYIEKASGTIMVLLTFLILLNALAVYLRNKFEVKY